MRDTIEEILGLQTEYSSANTPAMNQRGILVRDDFAGQLRNLLPLPGSEQISDLAVQGKDGVGRKTIIPWVRVYSKEKSPSATVGWYVVYLFSATGERVWLSLNQGTTRWDGQEFRQRPVEELQKRVDWARSRLSAFPDAERWSESIDLETQGSLGVGYEAGSVLALEYRRGAVPDNSVLAQDLAVALQMLALLYSSEAYAIDVPGESPDVVELEELADEIAGKSRRGRGIRLNVLERRAIERRAVDVTTEHLLALAYRVKDVGATKSYDLEARTDSQLLRVEVKGSTSTGSEIILTQNEVLLHREHYPNNALAIVHSIELVRGDEPSAQGGKLVFEQPWALAEESLTPMAYRYSTGL